MTFSSFWDESNFRLEMGVRDLDYEDKNRSLGEDLNGGEERVEVNMQKEDPN